MTHMEEEVLSNISETESRYFADIFLCCDVEKTGNVPILKATELFRSANLSNDIIRQILHLAQVPQTTLYITRKQFYSCLKLIAAQQASIPLRSDLIHTPTTLPLPRFSWCDSPSTIITANNGSEDGGLAKSAGVELHKQWVEVHANSPNLIQLTNNSINPAELANADLQSTDSEVEHNDVKVTRERDKMQNKDGSPEAWSTASDSPTPTNSVAERPWAKENLWHGLLCEEQRQLLATEEESSDRHSSDDDVDLESVFKITTEQREYYTKQFYTIQPEGGLLSGPVARMFFEKSRIPVEELRHIWQLCDVTRDGALSLEEFTAAMHLVVLRRNNIPLPHNLPPCLMLSSGGGSTTASTTAATEKEGTTQIFGQSNTSKNPPEADLLHLNDDDNEDDGDGDGDKENESASLVTLASGSSPIANILNAVGAAHSKSNSPVKVAQVTPPLPTKASTKHVEKDWACVSNQSQSTNRDWNVTNNREWTKFNESPTSNVSSPGLKPVNFDMQRTAQAVVSDPQILHPVALRVTPVTVSEIADENDSMRRSLLYENHERESSPKHVEKLRESVQTDLRSIQRPQPKKKLPAKAAGALPPPPQRESSISSEQNDQSSANGVVMSMKKEPPPLPPPRPHRHARSSSLDLNKLKLGAPLPPEIPPRISPHMTSQNSCDAQVEGTNTSFADFTQFPQTCFDDNGSGVKSNATTTVAAAAAANIALSPRQTISTLQSSQRISAFEVYRKPNSRNSQSPPSASSQPIQPAVNVQDLEKRLIQLTESVKQLGFQPEQFRESSVNEVMVYLRGQNTALKRICADLSSELWETERSREELRTRLRKDKSSTSSSVSNSNIISNSTHQTNV
ncbi:ralBP1-associated Eps domain-containing protein 2 [Lutzomyia longipalpis]|nr:ralBP1-associated Eps domain-containing protein 2 [Lutzomyia longipalpis]